MARQLRPGSAAQTYTPKLLLSALQPFDAVKEHSPIVSARTNSELK
ncbi:MAG: hypothetical protein NTV52_20755 [Acidobacteria bacterium]|nr:hypothetical protein [Acidobacteriota bacterium]